jgi:hypothetical protein
MKVTDRLHESGIAGPLLATILVSSTRYTVWPMHVWLRKVWEGFDLPPACAWIVSAAYFSFFVWLVLVLTKKGKQYPGMILDAICGGSLLTVAVVLHQPPVRMVLWQAGFGAASWVTILSSSVLVLARSMQRHEGKSQ